MVHHFSEKFISTNLTRYLIMILTVFIMSIFICGCGSQITIATFTQEVPTVLAPDSTASSPVQTPIPLPSATIPSTIIIPTLSFMPTETPFPVALNLTPASVLPQLGNAEDAVQALADHTSRNASITIMGESEPLLFEDAWCAQNQQILDDNLKHITWSFAINGRALPLDRFTQQTYEDAQPSQPTPQPLACLRYVSILKDWQPGKFNLQSNLIFDTSLNDGISTFPAGEIKKDSQVFVSRPSLDPKFMASPTQWQTVVENPFATSLEDGQIGMLKDDYFSGRADIGDNKYILTIDETYQSMTFRQNPTIKILSGPYFASISTQRIEGTSNQACYGLYFHYDYASLGFYQFIVCEDQTFMVNLHANGQWETLSDWKKSDAIQTGRKNRLGVVVNGSYYDFFINGQSVAKLTDQRLYQGYVGFLVKLPAGAQEKFEFTDFTIQAP